MKVSSPSGSRRFGAANLLLVAAAIFVSALTSCDAEVSIAGGPGAVIEASETDVWDLCVTAVTAEGVEIRRPAAGMKEAPVTFAGEKMTIHVEPARGGGTLLIVTAERSGPNERLMAALMNEVRRRGFSTRKGPSKE